MPKVRITFSALADPTQSRQVTLAEENRPETEEILVESTRKTIIEAKVFDHQASVLGVWVLDSKGSRIAKSRTEYTFRPTAKRAVGEEIAEVGEIAATQEDHTITVEVTKTANEPKTTEQGGSLTIPDTPGDEIALQPDGPGGERPRSPFETTDEPEEPSPRIVFEVRTAPAGETDPSNAIEVAHKPTTQDDLVGTKVDVPAIPGETEQVVFTRTYDPRSDVESPWKTDTVPVKEPTDLMTPVDGSGNPTHDFEDAWGSATIESVYGYPTMVVSGSEITNNEVPSMFADAVSGFPDSVFSMDDGPSMWSMETLFPYGRIELPEVDNGKDADFLIQAAPQVLDQNRITERSWFYECFNLFRQHEAQMIQQQDAGVGVRPAEGGDRDISMFGDRSDGSPIRIVQEVKCRPDGGSYGPYQVVRNPKQVRTCRYVTPRVTLLAHRGIRAPKLRRFWWRRRRWNRKWEYCVPYDPAGPGTPHIFTIPSEVLTVFNTPKVNVSVIDTAPASKVSYDVYYDDAAVPGQVQVYVEQVVRGSEGAFAGAWSATFPKAFAAAPEVTLGPSDPMNFSYAGFGGTTAAGITGGYLQYPGGPGIEGPQPGSGTVEYIARGSPLPQAGGGTLKLAFEIMGA